MTAVTAGQIAGARRSFSISTGAVDGCFVLILSALGIFGFRAVYGGSAYLVVGVTGIVLGIGVTELASRLRQPVLAEGVIAVLAFLLLGGATNTVRRIIPSGHTITALSHVGVYGWKELLTTAPPVGDSYNLLAIPYIVGLIAGVTGQSVARRTRLAAVPLVGPTAALVLGILFGARKPESVFLQGTLFGLLALVWVVLRFHRGRVVLSGSAVPRSRVFMAAGLLVTVGLTAGFVGPMLPGSGRDRVVLSKYVSPPFDANQQPSPLAGFRQYVQEGPLHSASLFTVSGLPTGSHIRIATMDAYNGIAWGFGADSQNPSASGDVFRRYGSTIQVQPSGQAVQYRVSVGEIGGVWLPEVGDISHVGFSGPSASALVNDFTYDTATETAAEPVGLNPGDTYTVSAFVPRTASPAELARASAGNVQIPDTGAPSVLQSDANSWSSGASGTYGRVMAIATHLHNSGFFSDGLEKTPLSLAGHSNGRLTRFLEGGGLVGSEIVGDEEQYAATFALMANSIGVPARVVLGATIGTDGVVTGADVQPWVEVNLAGIGWQPIYAASFMDRSRKAQQTPPRPAPNQPSAAPVQPPVASALHAPLEGGLPGANSSSLSHFQQPVHRNWHVPAWLVALAIWLVVVLGAVGTFAGGVTVMKGRRRQRRRHAELPAMQVAGAWSELVDICRDLGVHVPLRSTRREQALSVSSADLSPLARRGDASIFGPGQPTSAEVREYWSAVDEMGQQLRDQRSRLNRVLARLSLRSLLPAGAGT